MEFSAAHKSWTKLRCALLHTTKFEKLLFYFITISSVKSFNGIFCNKKSLAFTRILPTLTSFWLMLEILSFHSLREELKPARNGAQMAHPSLSNPRKAIAWMGPWGPTHRWAYPVSVTNPGRVIKNKDSLSNQKPKKSSSDAENILCRDVPIIKCIDSK